MPFGTEINIKSGATKPSVTDAAEHEAQVIAKRVMRVPSNFTTKVAVDGNNNPQYIGYAPRGSLTSEAKWMIRKVTYSGTILTDIQTGYGAWDNKATTVSYA